MAPILRAIRLFPNALSSSHPFPQASLASPPKPQSWPISCAQTAIMPTNSEIDARAAASSTKILNITDLPIQNIERTLFLFCSICKGSIGGGSQNGAETNGLVNRHRNSEVSRGTSPLAAAQFAGDGRFASPITSKIRGARGPTTTATQTHVLGDLLRSRAIASARGIDPSDTMTKSHHAMAPLQCGLRS